MARDDSKDFATSAPAASGPARPETWNVGPSHPATQGTVKFGLELDGETIVRLDLDVGYLHRGFEKECESRTWIQVVPYTDRLNYQSAILANLGFCLAAEKLLDLETPERCQWLRVLAAELSRVADHWTRCGVASSGLGAETPFAYAMEARELVWDLLEALTGARVTSHYVEIGGVKRDLPEGFAALVGERLPQVLDLLRDFEAMVTRNRGLMDRLRGTGVISRDDCLRFGVTGPILRSAGEPYDLRKAFPHLVYDEIDFDVPIGETGDNCDRLLVCVEEIRQSLRIVAQCLARLEARDLGPIRADDPRVGWPPRAGGPPGAETRFAAFERATKGPALPAGEAYQAVESANGELGFYLVSDGTENPVKVRCRPPSFLHLASLASMLEGAPLADLGPTFDLLNAVAGECDR